MNTLLNNALYIYHLTMIKVRNEFKSYSLGLLWWYVDPIVNTAVLYVVTVSILHQRSEGGALAMMAGMQMFRYLQSAIMGACNSLQQAIQLSARLYVPKYSFVIRDVAAETLKLTVGIAVLLFFLLGWKIAEFSLLETIVVIIVACTFVTGVSSIVALFSALIRDVRMVIGYILRVLFFLSGLFYGLDQVPEAWRTFFLLNPFALLVHEFRLAVISSEGIDYGWLGLLFVVSLGIGWIGFWALFKFDRELPKYVI